MDNPLSENQHIVILGAGFAGLETLAWQSSIIQAADRLMLMLESKQL